MSHTDDAPPIEIDCQTVKSDLDDGVPFLLLDCREQSEYDVARLPKAVLIPMSQLQARVGELEPHRDQRIVVHCHHGGRSLRVAHWLREQGYTKAQSMAGGIHAWSEQVDPAVPKY